ncbi:MAG TPA: hypothetical protein VGN17_28875 [Bryobacteraceae bacterium]
MKWEVLEGVGDIGRRWEVNGGRGQTAVVGFTKPGTAGPARLGASQIADNRGTITRPMAEPVTIPISIFEVTIRYERPLIRLLVERADIIQALFDSFAEFEPNADDLEVLSAGKTTEQGIRLRLASEKITLFFGAAYCKFSKEEPAWPEADSLFSRLERFLSILTKCSGVVLGKRTSVLSLHLQLRTASFKDILRPFIDTGIRKLDSAPLKAMALVARWPDYRITLDGSAQLANGIFVQMEREFDATASYEHMKEHIFADEVAVLKLLGVEVEA